ncbi:MAG: bis(5'-nucleosyl)-tetraphosphatase (symmetrical) YqeK [Clostridia bacterium]|nr:bis(5'-nucleosyl)-tetraphosphatase (symmetrical) YqeK [Clostridia bacterium]
MGKTGILGGMFDPVHRGHIAAARSALAYGLDRVLLLPCRVPPHRDAPRTEESHRLAMCRLALQGEENMEISSVDLRSGPCYAADTLKLLQKMYPQDEFYWILGADKLEKLSQWRDAAYLFENCRFLICPRPGYDENLTVPGAKTQVLSAAPRDISSSGIVECLRRCEDAEAFLHRDVARYVAEKGLYQRNFVPELLKRGMDEKRLAHTLGVRQEAVRLAYLHGGRMQAAAVAAMLHDIAKPLPLEEMQALANRYALALPRDMMEDGNLLHGPVAAAIARYELGVEDEEILSAIACHTTGKCGMTVLEMAVFLADAIEPGRRDYPGLEEMRKLSSVDLPGAVLLSMQRTQEYVLSRGMHFCTRTQEAMQDIVFRRKNHE